MYMFLRILKKDIQRKKSMNMILLLFVVMCSMFLASSVNNLLAISSALDYFFEHSNASEYYMIVRERGDIEEWLDESEFALGYERHDFIGIGMEDLTHKDQAIASFNISLSVLPTDYDFVFDQNDEKIQAIKDGEIALGNSICERNKIAVGDTIEVKFGDAKLQFRLAYLMKDVVFGSDFMSFNRAMISENDFEVLQAEAMSNTTELFMYSIKTRNAEVVQNEKHEYVSTMIAEFFGSDLKMTYIMDMMMFAIFIAVAVCLILIAFALLRFTINTTIQEDYKEIGIMRAIGLPDKPVISLYLVKYITIAIAGSVVGTFMSMPFGEIMMGTLRKNIVINSGSDFPVVSVASAAFIVLVLYLFCCYSAKKIVRLSAIQAIRSGSSGKRYSRKGKQRLKSFKHVKTVWFMAINDIASNRKNYTVLFITFIIGSILFLFPSNAASTLSNDEIIRYMGISKPDIFIADNGSDEIMKNPDYNLIVEYIQEMEEAYEKDGVLIDLYRTFMFSSSVYKENSKQSIPIYASQSTDDANSNLALLRGSYPKLADEILITEKTMKSLGVDIGDSLRIVIGADDRKYIIVGLYESMMNMGDGVQLSALANTDFASITMVHEIGGVFQNRSSIEEQIDTIRKTTPDFEIMSPEEYATLILPGIAETVSSWKDRIGVILLVVFCLISVLMSRTFYLKDLGDIALLKSIGFSNQTLHFWQILRISIAMLAATIIGFLLSIPLTPLINRFTFGIMGAPNIPTVVNYTEAYVFYPLIMLAGVGISIYFSTLTIRRVTMRDIGVIE